MWYTLIVIATLIEVIFGCLPGYIGHKRNHKYEVWLWVGGIFSVPIVPLWLFFLWWAIYGDSKNSVKK